MGVNWASTYIIGLCTYNYMTCHTAHSWRLLSHWFDLTNLPIFCTGGLRFTNSATVSGTAIRWSDGYWIHIFCTDLHIKSQTFKKEKKRKKAGLAFWYSTRKECVCQSYWVRWKHRVNETKALIWSWLYISNLYFVVIKKISCCTKGNTRSV